VKDVIKANKIIHYFVQNPKAHPLIPMISLIFSFFSKIALFHGNPGLAEQELARLLGVHPFFVKEYKTAARNYQLGKVIDCMGYIKEADLRSKGVDVNGVDNPIILKELIFKLMH
jgi:DNA polymerase-3 subunit delta